MNAAIILCSGNSTRMGSKQNKVLLNVLGKPLVYYAIKNFENSDLINSIIIVSRKEDTEKIKEIIEKYSFKKIEKTVQGGKERQDSSCSGLKAIKNAKKEDIVLFHNGCNPFVSEKEIKDVIKEAENSGAAALAFPAKDTLKRADEGMIVKESIDRKCLWHMQTPQAIKYPLALKAFENAKRQGFYATDDVSLVEKLGKKVKIVPCSYKNIKITTKDDLKIAECMFMENKGASNEFRVGFGQDSHAFSKDKRKKLVLGGCLIENENGLEAESDGDVILHALFNAISQSIGQRSLGYYATKMCNEGITDSKQYLIMMLGKLKEKCYKINNVGIMVEALKPKLEAYTENIKDSLSEILEISKDDIGITYTSGDGLTSFGRGKGMQCFVVVAIAQRNGC